MDKFEVKLDQAARAAWMSYVGGMTQDEIATQLGVSRPGVQRLLALARQEGLVKVHIDHPISTCMALGSTLRERRRRRADRLSITVGDRNRINR